MDDPLRAIFAVGSAMTLPAIGALALGCVLLLVALHRHTLAKAASHSGPDTRRCWGGR
ncbi:hypothetical protein [Micromonospora sp. CPCC 206061]|uniref:hypothetical protein n=1 Tax=Micromonospora sp. CPCC 206061 TaxID=3122410 RepID=UPI002FF22B8F